VICGKQTIRVGGAALLLLALGATADRAHAQDQAADPAKPAATAPVDARDDASLDAVVRQMRAAREQAKQRLQSREQVFKARLDESKAQLSSAEQALAAAEAEGRRLEGVFDANKTELADKAELLKDKIGALKELFGVFQQNASDLIGAFNGSATSLQYPDRDVWLEGFANRMKNASEVTSADDIKTLWFELLREINARGQIVRLSAPVFTPAGESSRREVVRLGGFSLITAQPSPAYLQWKAGQQRVETMVRQPVGPYGPQIERYLAGDQALSTVSLDPTGGTLIELLAEKPTVEERVDQGGLVGYMIIALGAVAFLLAASKLLDIAVISLRVGLQRRRMDQPKANNALGRLLLVYRDNAHADPETLEMRLHDRVAKETGRIQRFLVFLAIIAAVAPLMGLLGTVVGMINTFQAITLYGTGDPQTMAGGISQALITTVLGLVVAVPAVLLNAVVSARAKRVINRLRQQKALLLGDRLAERTLSSTAATSSPLGAPQTA